MPAPGQWAVDNHENREQILAAMATGKDLPWIRANLAPDISRMALGRYRAKVALPALRNQLQQLAAKGNAVEPADIRKAGREVSEQVSAAQPILETLRADKERLDQAWSWAEGEVVEKDGTHVRQGFDAKGVAAIARVKQGGLRMEAELTGALDTQSSDKPAEHIGVHVHFHQHSHAAPEPNPPSSPQLASESVIEVEAVPIDTDER